MLLLQFAATAKIPKLNSRKQFVCNGEVACCEPFGESAVNGQQHCTRIYCARLAKPQLRKVVSRSQLPR